MRTALDFNGHSLGDSSIASLQVSKKCTVTFEHVGRATRWAFTHFLVNVTETSMSVVLVVRPECTLVALHAAPW